MRACIVLVLAWVAGCAVDGRRIRQWNLDGAQTVTLPTRFFGDVHEADIVLHARAELLPAERGRELTLVFDCFHGEMRASAEGQPLVDHGDTGVGEHVFAVPASLTSGPAIAFVVTLHHDAASSIFGVGAAPRLAPASPIRAPATFDRYIASIEIMVIVVLGLVFTLQYLLDRRRRADGAFAVQAFAALGAPLWQLGVLDPLGSFALPVLLTAMTVVVVALLAFLRYSFGFPTYPWRLAYAYGGANIAAIAGAWSMRLELAVWLVLLALQVPLYVYIVPRLFRLALRGDKRFEARMILGASGVSIVPLAVLAVAVPQSGWHVEAFGIIGYGCAQALILSYQQVTRSREVERANTELQHQVAARSKELADALAKLAKQPRVESDSGQVIDGRYRVVKKLGAGGMGSVHEVARISDDKRFALKRVRGHADADALARFAREAQIAAELRHANLVPVVDVGIADGELFLVMPLVDGGALEDARGKFGSDLAWARRVLAEVARGLAALHGRGIVHRDLKPGNILVARGVARIADFGLAYFADTTAHAKTVELGARAEPDDTVTGKLGRVGLTRAGDVFGTVPYMAPELARGVHAAAPPSDVFAFGVIAFELATGRSPFHKAPVLVALAGGTYAPPSTTAIDASLRTIIDGCLAAEPSRRPTADELAASLTTA